MSRGNACNVRFWPKADIRQPAIERFRGDQPKSRGETSGVVLELAALGDLSRNVSAETCWGIGSKQVARIRSHPSTGSPRAGRETHYPFGFHPSCGVVLIIHGTPNLSIKPPKPGDQKVSPKGIVTLPPAES